MGFIKWMLFCAKLYFSIRRKARTEAKRIFKKYKPGVYSYTIDAAEAWKR